MLERAAVTLLIDPASYAFKRILRTAISEVIVRRDGAIIHVVLGKAATILSCR
jgi:hypothetical protein